MKQFQQELTALKQRVVDMGTLAGAMVAGSSDALVKGERSHIEQGLADEPILDRLQIDIDPEWNRFN